MIFSSPFYVFFLIFSLYFYAIVRPSVRPCLLIFLNVFWYSSWGLGWSLFFFGLSALTYALLYFGGRSPRLQLPTVLTALLGTNFFIFLVLKSLPLINPEWSAPYGVSFYFLTLLALLLDLRRKNLSPADLSFNSFVLMPSFYPILMSGPILRSKNFLPQTKTLFEKSLQLDNVVDGFLIFFEGYFKYSLFHSGLEHLTARYFVSFNENPFSFLFGCFLFTFKSYVDFSSYCDMGRGAARCFGLTIPINFKPFYYAKNPNDLWARWNISLGEWIRDYVSFPLMLRFGKKINQTAIITFSFVLIGLWHEFNLNWLFFGLYNGFLISAFYLAQLKFNSKSPGLLKIVGRILALCLFVGNGLLVNSDFLKIVSSGFSLNTFVSYSINWPQFYALLALLLVFEFFQEQLNNPDFYLKLHRRAKFVLVSALFVCFLWQLYNAFYLDFYELPPAYFKF
ncbi:MAG: MBOAT family O-acyltransferase [Pseudobdellovibrio sp.]